MSKWLRRLLWVLGTLVVIGGPAYYLLVLHSPAPGKLTYSLDLAEVRALANSLAGEKPSEVRLERVMDFEFAEAMVVAGDPWKGTLLPVYSYQLVFPSHTIVIDAAMDRAQAKPERLVPLFDDAAYARMSAALEKATLIVVTHEHMDHIGGIAAHPRLEQLLPALRLTEAQLRHPDRMKPYALPEALFQDYPPLVYRELMALAPGVVLIEAPGHTPGSQMIYVQQADGREMLLIGDVAWHQRSIDLLRERPLFMTAMIQEDRHAVLAEFTKLKALGHSNPEVRIVPGHDLGVIEALVADGYLKPGFIE